RRPIATFPLPSIYGAAARRGTWPTPRFNCGPSTRGPRISRARELSRGPSIADQLHLKFAGHSSGARSQARRHAHRVIATLAPGVFGPAAALGRLIPVAPTAPATAPATVRRRTASLGTPRLLRVVALDRVVGEVDERARGFNLSLCIREIDRERVGIVGRLPVRLEPREEEPVLHFDLSSADELFTQHPADACVGLRLSALEQQERTGRMKDGVVRSAHRIAADVDRESRLRDAKGVS